jgi:hypothetical protein
VYILSRSKDHNSKQLCSSSWLDFRVRRTITGNNCVQVLG